jgi:hypothetical protein
MVDRHSLPAEDSVRRPSHRAISFHRNRGRWSFTIYGWGIRYKNSFYHLPNFDERIGEVRNFKIGRHWFKLLRP